MNTDADVKWKRLMDALADSVEQMSDEDVIEEFGDGDESAGQVRRIIARAVERFKASKVER